LVESVVIQAKMPMLKKFLLWSLLNAAILVLPLISLPLLAAGGPDIDGMKVMLGFAGLGTIFGVVLVVFPSALFAELRFRRRIVSRMHYVPYATLIPYSIAVASVLGIAFGVLMIMQFIVVLLLHFLMARQYRLAQTSEVNG
jgi:hypothetical protein